MSGRSTHPLDLSIVATTGGKFAAFLSRHLLRAHRLLGPPLREMSLVLVGDRRMAELHKRFMGIAGPTDVLTFPLEHDRRAKITGGEVVVCVPQARRRARTQGASVRNELLLYALHGMLHLCGFDDRTPRDFARMHRTEDDILTRLGVGPIFSTSQRRNHATATRSLPAGSTGPVVRHAILVDGAPRAEDT